MCGSWGRAAVIGRGQAGSRPGDSDGWQGPPALRLVSKSEARDAGLSRADQGGEAKSGVFRPLPAWRVENQGVTVAPCLTALPVAGLIRALLRRPGSSVGRAAD